jgi:hypothetical protein
MQVSMHAELIDIWLRFVNGLGDHVEAWSDEDLIACLKVCAHAMLLLVFWLICGIFSPSLHTTPSE